MAVKSKSWHKPDDHKPFKGGKRKNNKGKGRVQTKKATLSSTKASSKADRKNTARILQKNKRCELVEKARLFKGKEGAPKQVLVIPLSSQLCAGEVVGKLTRQPLPKSMGPVSYRSEAFDANILYVPCKRRLLNILRLAAVADYIILVVSETVEQDAWSRQLQSALRAQGLPSVMPMIQLGGMVSSKTRQSVTKEWQDYFMTQYPDLLCSKLLSVDSESDRSELERLIAQRQLKPIGWRDAHPYMMTMSHEFIPNADQSSVGTLQITGYMRGKPFSANHMIHLSQLGGDFCLDKIELRASGPVRANRSVDAMSVELTQVRDPLVVSSIQSMVSHNQAHTSMSDENRDHDTAMDTEDPVCSTTSALSNSATGGNLEKTKTMKRISSYQAAWIPADELEDDEQIASSDESDSTSENGSDACSDPSGDEHDGLPMKIDDRTTVRDEALYEDDDTMNAMQIEQDLEAYRQRKLALSRDDHQWPDEVELPMDTLARDRFQKYQAVKSFRTGSWDEHDKLPQAYASLCQFQNFKQSSRKALSAEALHSPFAVGQCVTLHVADVSQSSYSAFKETAQPLVCFGLLQYENQASVLHFTVDRTADYDEPIENKEPFVLLIGYRMLQVTPLFSELSRGQLHKMYRYLPSDKTSVGTIYGSIQFGQPPTLLFKTEENFPATLSYAEEPVQLCSTGTLMSMDPTRCVIKRITLTGDPFKVHKNSAVIRHMFFNPEDVKYFRPVQLATKSGRVGHIKESLGTHGYMKCVFDRSIQQQDSVCLHLYKRVFPKSFPVPYVLL